ncbi:Protein SUPPRESSOR OF npr1-1, CONSTITUTIVE 1 [Morella rubra]|uniref:Protein SUPPRESSOR OF npr1-1, CONSTITUTIVE 1 n=1 Tax=Morella rubra TaxID=262757 RepID=A0A6A1WR59_9ROSI|nr:Protein SUPPRESSOR OF npr1-1, CONSTITUTIVE 1 [Morella rubra]
MKKLRILKIGNRDIQGNFCEIHDILSTLEWCGDPLKSLPTNELRLLELWGYPFQSLPTSFLPNNLVQLRMCHSRIKQLWMGCNVSLGNLKGIDLSGSEELIEILDFSGVPNLERLELQDCTSLSKVHCLSLAFCENLSILPSAICSSSTLRYLRLTGCTRLEKFPDLSGMQCLEYMEAIETAITDLPSPDLFPKSTMRIVVSGCKHLPLESKELRLSSRECSRTYDMESVFWFSWERFRYLRALRICYEVERGYYEMFHVGVGGNVLGEYLKDHVVDSMMTGTSFAREIPEWFKNKHTDSFPFMICTDVDYSRKWMGYALFIVYEVDECRGFNHMKAFNMEFKSHQMCPEVYCYDKFCCLFDTHKSGVSTTNLDLWVPHVSSLGLIGFWAFIPAWWFLENETTSNFDGERFINAVFSPELQFGCGDPNGCLNPGCSTRIKQLGVRLVYEDDASEFYSTFAPHGAMEEEDFYGTDTLNLITLFGILISIETPDQLEVSQDLYGIHVAYHDIKCKILFI